MKCRKLAGKPNISCKKKNTERRVGVHPHKLFGGKSTASTKCVQESGESRGRRRYIFLYFLTLLSIITINRFPEKKYYVLKVINVISIKH